MLPFYPSTRTFHKNTYQEAAIRFASCTFDKLLSYFAPGRHFPRKIHCNRFSVERQPEKWPVAAERKYEELFHRKARTRIFLPFGRKLLYARRLRTFRSDGPTSFTVSSYRGISLLRDTGSFTRGVLSVLSSLTSLHAFPTDFGSQKMPARVNLLRREIEALPKRWPTSPVAQLRKL